MSLRNLRFIPLSELGLNFKSLERSLNHETLHAEIEVYNYVRINRIQPHMISREHMKMFSSTNQLFQDRWNPYLLYFIADDLSVYMIVDNPDENKLSPPVLIYSDANLWQDMHNSECIDETLYQPSVTFPSDQSALLTDGQGYLKLLNTGNRMQSQMWSLCNWMRRPDSFIIYDSVTVPDKNSVKLLTGQVCEDTRTKKFTSILKNTAMALNDKGELTVTNTVDQQPVHTFNIDYASVLNDGSYLLASNSYQFDSGHAAGMKRTDLLYIWQQDDSSVTAYFSIQPDLEEADVSVVLQENSFYVKVAADIKVRGDLFSKISLEESQWSLPDENTEQLAVKRLVIKCVKKDPQEWKDFMMNSTKGEQIFDSSMINEMLTCLNPITKDGLQPGPAKFQAGSAFMAPREDCDATDQDQPIFLVELSGGSVTPNHVVNVSGDQWLFNIPAMETRPQSFCVRHGEDGLVFVPSSDDKTPVSHDATFNALGYIQASKQRRRFSTCSPDFSYAVIAEIDTHVYVYRQPEPIDTDMRNRKTGKAVRHTAKQQVITLEENNSVLGVAALQHALYILTKSTIFKYIV